MIKYIANLLLPINFPEVKEYLCNGIAPSTSYYHHDIDIMQECKKKYC